MKNILLVLIITAVTLRASAQPAIDPANTNQLPVKIYSRTWLFTNSTITDNGREAWDRVDWSVFTNEAGNLNTRKTVTRLSAFHWTEHTNTTIVWQAESAQMIWHGQLINFTNYTPVLTNTWIGHLHWQPKAFADQAPTNWLTGSSAH